MDLLKDNSFSTNLSVSYNLRQVVTKPTRVTKTSETLIDHIYLFIAYTAHNVTVKYVYLSGHHYVTCIIGDYNNMQTKSKLHHTVKTRAMKNLDADALKSDLHLVPWSTIDVFDDVDDALSAFESLFKGVWDLHAPMKTVHRHHKVAPWISKDIYALRRNRDHHYKKFLRNKSDIIGCTISRAEISVIWLCVMPSVTF